MKALRYLGYLLGVLIMLMVLVVVTDTSYLWRAAKGTWLMGNDTANINDHIAFPTRVIKTGTHEPWPESDSLGETELPAELRERLLEDDTIAFLVVHRGQIIAEEYFQGYDNRSRTNSFSMAKTVVAMLLEAAIEDGYISSVDQPVTELLPEFSGQPYAESASIGSLSGMSSGYEWNENYYNAFSPMVRLLYGHDTGDYVLQGEFTREPDSYFYYSSASTQLLGLSITRALQAADPNLNLSNYLSEKIWQPLGMNDDALWHLDGKGLELAYCCLNTNARNFAKLGQLMLQNGVWQGKQLIKAAAIEALRTPRGREDYGFGTWISNDATPPFYGFRGHLGQYITILPDHDLIVVRLGETRGGLTAEEFSGEVLPFYNEQALKLIASDVITKSETDNAVEVGTNLDGT